VGRSASSPSSHRCSFQTHAARLTRKLPAQVSYDEICSAAFDGLIEAVEAGLIRDFRVFAVGDDLHLLMSHRHGVDANALHLLAFRTFWRMVWVTELIGYKPYGLAQDLKIGPATKGKRVDDLAEPSDRFVALLAGELPEPERSFLGKIRSAQTAWRGGRASVEVRKPFSGNVTGQGPGFAELPVRNTWRVGLFAADKAGPAAFNVPVYRAALRALDQEAFRARYGESLAFEIYDVHDHRRIFLDARAHREDIETLLGATNLFNVKRLWSLPQAVAQREAVRGAVGDILLAASTEKLALITGGEYVGKDDPVLLGVEELVAAIAEYMRGGFLNLSNITSRSHLMRAVFEGLSMNWRWLREPAEKLSGRKFQYWRLTGGGALSDFWSQIMADVVGIPMHRQANPRIHNVLGMGLLAFSRLGKVKVEDIPAMVKFDRIFEPDPKNRAIYDEMYGHFSVAREKIRPVLHAMNKS